MDASAREEAALFACGERPEDLLVVDEIGKMELTSDIFAHRVTDIQAGPARAPATVQAGMGVSLVPLVPAIRPLPPDRRRAAARVPGDVRGERGVTGSSSRQPNARGGIR